MSRLQTQLAGIELSSPIVAASGTCGYVAELAEAFSLELIGAVTTKSITREPREGNDPWRIIGVPGGMLNAIGLANVGLDRFLSEKAPLVASAPCRVFGSVAGHSVEDYVSVAAAMDSRTQLPMIELNVSCPNTSTGLQFGDDPTALRGLLQEVRATVRRAKLFAKMTPNANVVAMSRAAVESGVDGLTLTNTFPAMSLDVETRKARLSRGAGGLSGPGIHPIVVRMVSEVYRTVAREAGVPIIGLGGVIGWQDAAEFVLAGASAVGVGTALFVEPRTPVQVARGLEAWAARQGVARVQDLVGAAAL
jgi:dihydroorotate dehydrogenase (NAD+) catalytic subunit